MATQRTVKDLLSNRTLITTHPDATLKEALSLIQQRNVHRLAVVNSDGTLAGVVSVSDLRLACESPLFHPADEIKKNLGSKKVAEVMSKAVQVCELDDPVLAAAKLLRVGDVSGLIVMGEDKKPLGVVSRTDLLDELIRILEPEPLLEPDQQ